MSTKKETQKTAESNAANNKTSQGFSDVEKAAMKERAKELKAEARAARTRRKGKMLYSRRSLRCRNRIAVMAARLHEIIKANAPSLSPKTWYGMPAYAKDGNVVCFFQSAQKFKTRYATFGFSDVANLDEGDLWPIGFALKELTAAEEARIIALVKKAVS